MWVGTRGISTASFHNVIANCPIGQFHEAASQRPCGAGGRIENPAAQGGSESSTVPELPESIWAHPLFIGSACFTPPTAWFSASRVDHRIRQLRNMPSSSDESVDAALTGVENIMLWGRKWIETSASPSSLKSKYHLKRLDQVRQAIETGTVSQDMATRMVDRVVSDIATFTNVPDLTGASELKQPPESRIASATRCLLDCAMLSDPELKPRYLKRLHRALDCALEYNATSDDQRNWNVILWLRRLMESASQHHASYIDVGCSVKTGATDTIRAATILRPGDICSEVHGSDIVAPRPELVNRMFSRHRIRLYQADPVRQPLYRKYDAILLANVHRHLDATLQRQLLGNLGASLTEGGLLIINWRFGATNSPCICLQRRGRILSWTAETDVSTASQAPSQQLVDNSA
ncbi:MAG: class I SAM-dependent methyltransferase [bacterium]